MGHTARTPRPAIWVGRVLYSHLHRRTQRIPGRATAWSCTLLLVRWNELHTGLLRLSLRPLLSCCLLQRRHLPLMELVDGVLDRLDGVVETTVALETVPGDDVSALRGDEQKLDRMLTVGTAENEMLRRWHGVYNRLADDLQRFRYDTDDMLTDYFEELPSRRPEAYAAAFESCMASFREIYMQTEDEEDLAYMSGRRINFPVGISFVVERDKRTGQPFMAERMTFEDLISFLYMDLYRGMVAGNVPRQCHNCGRWFLAIGAYDTVYCQRVAPGEEARTCRQVGAHKKEREKNGKDFACREYARAYNRLKTWKQRGKISAEEWNRRVAHIQDVKSEFLAGGMSDAEYTAKLERV